MRGWKEVTVMIKETSRPPTIKDFTSISVVCACLLKLIQWGQASVARSKWKKNQDIVLFHNRHSSFLECPLLLFGILALNIVAFCEHFHVWSLMSDLRPKETASISECCGRERSVHRDVLCGLQPDHFFYKLFLLHSRSLIHKLFALLL